MTTKEEIIKEYDRVKKETNFSSSRERDEFKMFQNRLIIELLINIRDKSK